MSKFSCPACGSNLMHERIYDGTDLNEIEPGGEVLDKGSKSNGSSRIYCKSNEEHDIPLDLQEAVLDLVE